MFDKLKSLFASKPDHLDLLDVLKQYFNAMLAKGMVSQTVSDAAESGDATDPDLGGEPQVAVHEDFHYVVFQTTAQCLRRYGMDDPNDYIKLAMFVLKNVADFDMTEYPALLARFHAMHRTGLSMSADVVSGEATPNPDDLEDPYRPVSLMTFAVEMSESVMAQWEIDPRARIVPNETMTDTFERMFLVPASANG